MSKKHQQNGRHKDAYSDIDNDQLLVAVDEYVTVLNQRGIDPGYISREKFNEAIKTTVDLMALQFQAYQITAKIYGVMAATRDQSVLIKAVSEYRELLSHRYQNIITFLDLQGGIYKDAYPKVVIEIGHVLELLNAGKLAELMEFAMQSDPVLPEIMVFATEAYKTKQAEIAQLAAAQSANAGGTSYTTKDNWKVERRIVRAVLGIKTSAEQEGDKKLSQQNEAAYEYSRQLDERKRFGHLEILKPLSDPEIQEYNFLNTEKGKGNRAFTQWISKIVNKHKDKLDQDTE